MRKNKLEMVDVKTRDLTPHSGWIYRRKTHHIPERYNARKNSTRGTLTNGRTYYISANCRYNIGTARYDDGRSRIRELNYTLEKTEKRLKFCTGQTIRDYTGAHRKIRYHMIK